MRLVERQHITHTHPHYEYCRNITHLSKNLYNAALYVNRQHFFQTHSYYSDISIINEFTRSDNVDYRALPSKVAKQTIRQVHKDFTSFFKLLKLKQKGECDKKVNIPGYKDKAGYTSSLSQKKVLAGNQSMMLSMIGIYILCVVEIQNSNSLFLLNTRMLIV